MRLVADTNTIISGLLWHGTPARLIDAAIDKRVTLFTSLPLLDELENVLMRDKFKRQIAQRDVSIAEIFEGYMALVEIVTPANITPVISRDPDDDVVLASAVAAKADYIVSGDAHLLDLQSYAGIQILPASTLLQKL